MITTTYILTYFIFCIASVGLGRLYIYLIQPNNLFAFMQPILVELKSESNLLYKSLGGCDVCTRQRFTDITFLLFLYISPSVFTELNIILSVLIHLFIYSLFGGLAFYFDALITNRNTSNFQPQTKQKHIEI